MTVTADSADLAALGVFGRRLEEAERQAARVKSGAVRYYDDPVGFAADCIDWRGTDGLAEYQEEIMGALPQRKRIAVRGPHGLMTGQEPLSRRSLSCGSPLPVTLPGSTGRSSQPPGHGTS